MTERVYGEIYSPSDALGRCHYALFWMTNYHPGHPKGEHRRAKRGQHFFGPPPPGISYRDKGSKPVNRRRRP